MSTFIVNGATGQSDGTVTGIDPDEVMADTWGHLDSEPGRYAGSIVFAVGVFGDGARAIVSAEFGDAGYGPWFYDAVNAWVGDQGREAGVYRFDGHYVVSSRGRRFSGRTTRVDVEEAR